MLRRIRCGWSGGIDRFRLREIRDSRFGEVQPLSGKEQGRWACLTKMNTNGEQEFGGYFDLQVNGFDGVDFQQDDLPLARIEAALRSLRAHQTTRILYTFITERVDRLCSRLEQVESLRKRSELVATAIAGYHLEGPYLRPEEGYHGAHNPALMKAPAIAEFERLWSASGGNLRLITLAPEWKGAPEFIEHVTKRNVRVAIGHSNANDRQIDDAIAAGMSLCTHLGNGVPMVLPRHDNIIQRLLARDELFAVFVPDGVHVPPRVLRNFVRAKPKEKVLFTTDCMAAAGAGPGRYRLGQIEAEVGSDGIVREPGRTNLAGSSLTMDRGAENVQTFLGWTKAEAIEACSERVAAFFGLS